MTASWKRDSSMQFIFGIIVHLPSGHANFIREYYGDGNKYVVETDDDGTGGRSTATVETIVDTGENFV